MAEAFAVQGFKELNKALDDLPRNLQRRAVNKGVRAGAALVRDRAKLNVPVRSGALRRNIKIKARRRRDRGIVQYDVGVEFGKRNLSAARKKRGEDPYYWYFQEFGYRAVGRAKAKGRKGRERRKNNARKIPGKRFMRNAFGSTRNAVVNKIRDELANEINRLSSA